VLDRRHLLKTGAASATLALLSTPVLTSVVRAAAAKSAATPAQVEAGKNLAALFDSFVQDAFDHSPELVTSLGLDKGKRAHQKAELSQASLAEIARNKAETAEQYKKLSAIDPSTLSEHDRISYEVVMFSLKNNVAADKAFDYGTGGAASPYVLSQLSGAYGQVPDFLDSQHSIETKDDAEAYLSRLAAFGRMMDQEREVAKHDAGIGCVPPDFVLSRTLDQMAKFRATPVAKSVLVESIARRTKDKKIDGDWAARATKIVTDTVYPALDRQIALLKDLQKKSTHDAGVWKLNKGDEYYRDAITFWTTSAKAPAEIHKIGLDMVAEHTAQIDTIMKANGMTKGTVGERLRGMYNDPKFRYPNTDAGKDKLLEDLNKKVKEVTAKLPKYFGTLPKAGLVIKRVPKYTEAGAPGGYYNNASLDGSRPGTYYINLRDTAEVPSWTLPTLTFHEGIPGHHLQLSIQQEADIAMIRKLSFFSAYIEGWALYAEQLAVEMGMYDNDPWGHIGQLHDAMFRGVRLVVDTGIHAMKWSREKAIRYYVDMLGDQEASATTEIERYCVWPGQACSYMLGKIEILELRDKARAALGSRFDIRKFHDAILLNGAVPLTVLETEVEGYIQAARG